MKTFRTLLLGLSMLLLFHTLHGQNSLRKNSIILETNYFFSSSLSYTRILVGEKTNFFLSGGYAMGTFFGTQSHWMNIEGGLLLFGPKHFFETGPGLMIGLNDITYPGFKVAYRIQGTRGFVFRLAMSLYFPESAYFAPSIGLGYAF
jgi:hypothetical protein